MVVCTSVGAADDHDGVAGGGGGVVDAVVINGRLEEVRVGFEPVAVSSSCRIVRDMGMLTISGC